MAGNIVPGRDRAEKCIAPNKGIAAKNAQRIAHTCHYISMQNDSKEHQLLSHNLTRTVQLSTSICNMKLLVGVSLVEKNRSVKCKWILPVDKRVS